MNTPADPNKRDRWARLRFSIIGPLLAAPPAPKTLYAALQALAAKSWRHPVSGLDICFAASTMERWYYLARRGPDPVAALKDRLRGDVSRFPSLTPLVINTLTLQYREHPGWTMQLHFDNLCAALKDSDTTIASWPASACCTRPRCLIRHTRTRNRNPSGGASRDA